VTANKSLRKKDMIKILKGFITAIRNAKEIREFTCKVTHDTKEIRDPPYSRMKPTGWTDVKLSARFLTKIKKGKT